MELKLLRSRPRRTLILYWWMYVPLWTILSLTLCLQNLLTFLWQFPAFEVFLLGTIVPQEWRLLTSSLPISIHFTAATSPRLVPWFSLLWIHVQKSSTRRHYYYREPDLSLFVMGRSARYFFHLSIFCLTVFFLEWPETKVSGSRGHFVVKKGCRFSAAHHQSTPCFVSQTEAHTLTVSFLFTLNCEDPISDLSGCCHTLLIVLLL